MSKIKFYDRDMLCTEIQYTIPSEPIHIINHTDDMVLRAFGINTAPTWDDLEEFLRSRCFPETRANARQLLRILGVDYYDPWEIVKKTQGKMAEDHQWLEFVEE